MQRRRFLGLSLMAALGAVNGPVRAGGKVGEALSGKVEKSASQHVKLFLCGDVMTGRGIDQIMPHPVSPEIYEPYMTSAIHYVEIAERTNGPIPRNTGFDYIWGDVLPALQNAAPDVRIINLETAVTASNDYWAGKGINYRMHPANVPCLTAAGIDCCVLANNHVLDWGYEGLQETLATLHRSGIRTAGAGVDISEAMSPAIFEMDNGSRVIIFSMASTSSGTGRAWAAGRRKPGVWLFPDLSRKSLDQVAQQAGVLKRPGDIVVASIHWGSNWGYPVPPDQRRFAHALIDEAGIDLVHGHSSHHPRGMERYRNKLILYGCGDFLNDYEGIRGQEQFRGDLALMYLPVIDTGDGTIREMTMQVMQIHRFRLRRASPGDSRWLAGVLDRESRKLGGSVEYRDGHLRLN